RVGRPPPVLCLASMALPVPCSGGGHAALVRRTSPRNNRTSVNDAGYSVAGYSWEISCELAVPVARTGVDVPDGDYGGIPWPSGFRPNPVWLRWEYSDFRRIPCHHLHDFGFHAKSSDQFYSFRCHLSVSDSLQLAAGD